METAPAVEPVPRVVVEAFFRALANRDFVTLAGYLADDVIWTIGGPVDLLPFCGVRVGKASVMTLLDRITPAFVDGRRFIVNAMLVDGDRAAVLAQFVGTKRLGGRAISFRTTHFIRFSGEKVIEYLSIIDSFDAVEQVLGHSLALQDDRKSAGADDLVAV
jgi:ketosteroid isomerase-like protein